MLLWNPGWRFGVRRGDLVVETDGLRANNRYDSRSRISVVHYVVDLVNLWLP